MDSLSYKDLVKYLLLLHQAEGTDYVSSIDDGDMSANGKNTLMKASEEAFALYKKRE